MARMVGTRWIVLALACACTLDSKSAGEEAGDSGSSDDSATNTMSATGSTVSATSSEESGTGGPMCEQYESAPDIGPAVDIAVRSEATTPVYFASTGCFPSLRLDVVGPDGVAVDHILGECAETCDAILSQEEGGCLVGCPDCGTASGERIEPAGEDVARWTGRSNTVLDLDTRCVMRAEDVGVEPCPATCKREDQAPAGTYEVSLTVYRSCTGDCACDGEVVPTCGLWGQIELSDPEVYTVTIDYPAQTTAEIVIVD